jgi:Domain of unknown function (DUF4381)
MNADWLTQLAPAHAPAAPGWWPPAPGWWAAAILLIFSAIAFACWVRAARPALRRKALRQLQHIRSSDADAAAVARAIENLLRRYALTVFDKGRIARLTGEAWLNFVIAEGAEALAGVSGHSLLAAAFGNHDIDDRQQWLAGAEAFIKRAGRRRRPRERA